MFRLCVALIVLGAVLACAPARAAPPPVEAYGKLPAVDQISLSPKGDRYAVIVVDGETRKLMVADIAESKALLSSNVGAAKVVGIDWAGEDHLLVTVSQTVPLGFDFTVSKAEVQSVIVVDLRSHMAAAVFHKQSSVAQVVEGQYGVAQLNGHWFGFFGGITYGSGLAGDRFVEHMWPDLYKVDLDSGATTLVARGGDFIDRWLVGPDGAIIARATYDDSSGNWQVLTGASGGRLLASGQNKLNRVGALERGRTPDTIVIDRPVGTGSTFQELNLSGASADKSPDDEHADELLTDPETGLWIGTLSDGDQPAPTFFSALAQARVRGALKAFPGQNARLVSHTSNFERMLVETSGLGDPGTYWLVDIIKLSAVPLANERLGIAPDQVGAIKMVDWKAADGLALHGVLSLPPGRDAKNLPVIVMPHGGPEARDYPVFDWWAQLFASRGYAVFQPNFRGSSGYGLPFRDAGFGQIGRKMQTDISDGLAELARQGVVDPKRACIVGWSYGGYAAQAGVTLQSGLYRCAVSMAGLSDLGAFLQYIRDETGADSDSVRYWKTFMGVSSFLEGEVGPISPAKHARDADAPILLIHGKDDTVVPIAQSQAMARALKGAGKPVEFVTLPGADHWLLHEDTRLAMAKASLEFVLKYDPPDPDPVPAANPEPAVAAK